MKSMSKSVRYNLLLAFLLPFATSGAIYGYSMAPDVYVSDFAEFQYLPAKLGVPHPNGFPFFMLVGWAWSHLPIGTLAWRMNLLAVLTGAMAIGVTSAFVYHIQKRMSQALVTGLLLTLTPTLWKYSVAAERYGLNLFLICASFWCAWMVGRSERARWIAFSSGFFALALTTHPTSAVIGPIWFIYLVSNSLFLRYLLERSWRPWLALVTSFMPLLLYLYIPWRWASFLNAPAASGIGQPQPIYQGMVPAGYKNQLTVDVIWTYLTFGADMIRRGRSGFLDRLSTSIAEWWSHEFAWWVIALALIGVIHAWHYQRRLILAIVSIVALFVITVANTTQAKVDAYLLPATWAVLLCAGFGADAVYAKARRLERPWLRSTAYVVLVLGTLSIIAWQFVSLWPTHNQSRYIENRRDWETILAHPLQQNGALLADWSDLTPFWYMQQSEHRRTDLLGLFPPQPEQVIRPWIDAGNDLYLVAPLQNGYAPNLAKEYTLTPWGKTVRIQPKGAAFSCPAELTHTIDTPPEWTYQITNWDVHFQEDVGGRVVRLFFCWSAPKGIEKTEFMAFALINQAGETIAVINQPLFPSWYPEDADARLQQGVGVVSLYLNVGVVSDNYTMRLTSFQTRDDYTWQGGNRPSIDLGGIAVAGPDFARYLLPNEFTPLIAPRSVGLALRAWSISDEVVRPGDPIAVMLTWERMEQSPSSEPLNVRFQFWDTSGVRSTTELYPFSSSSDKLFRTRHILNAPVALGDASYLVEVQIVSGTQGSEQVHRWEFPSKVWLGLSRVRDRKHQFEVPGTILPLDIGFTDQSRQAIATLVGYKIADCNRAQVNITLYWRAHTKTEQSYRVFVHMIDEENHIIAQHDGIPSNGELPTTAWIEGEIIEDHHLLQVTTDSAGHFRIQMGLYTEELGRLVPEKDVEIPLPCIGEN